MWKRFRLSSLLRYAAGVVLIGQYHGTHASDNVISSCAITPEVYIAYEAPKEFARSSSLIRRSGALNYAKGRVVVIEGRVMDSKCVPIANSVIKMWQLNSRGLDQLANNRGRQISSKKFLSLYDDGFAGSGMATTDNLGYYRFITVMPGYKNGSIPRINFIVEHPDFIELSTVMFFSDVRVRGANGAHLSYVDSDVLKQFPDILRKLLVANRKDKEPNGIATYSFNMVMGGKQPYKSYKGTNT